MQTQITGRFTLQGASHVLNIYRYPQEYSLRQRCLMYRYAMQNHETLKKINRDFPSIDQLKTDINTLLEECIASEDNYSTAYELADIMLDCDEVLGRRILGRIRIIDEQAAMIIAQQHPNILHREQEVSSYSNNTVYGDSQNVHNSTINISVKDICKKLMQNYSHSQEYQTLSLSVVESALFTRFGDPSISDVLRHIQEDVATFNIGITLEQILKCVWVFIQTHQHKEELETRLIEELQEMRGYCASGHMSRLVNVIQGYTEEDLSIRISETDQINAVVRQYLSRVLQECKYEIVAEGMIDKSDVYKYFLREKVKEKIDEWRNTYGKEIVHVIPNIVNKFADTNVYV